MPTAGATQIARGGLVYRPGAACGYRSRTNIDPIGRRPSPHDASFHGARRAGAAASPPTIRHPFHHPFQAGGPNTRTTSISTPAPPNCAPATRPWRPTASCAPATWPRRWACPRAQWVAAAMAASRRLPLHGEPQAIFRDLGTLGEVMALTRNDWCVHERHGRYQGHPGRRSGRAGAGAGHRPARVLLVLALGLGRGAGWAAQPAVLRRRGRGRAQGVSHRGHRCGRLRRAGRASRGSVAVAGKHAGRARPTPPAWPTASSGAPPGWA